MPQYVQHISGQGEKWEVDAKWGEHNDYSWPVKYSEKADHFYLPKSEYRLVEPPERWVDVTEQCRWQEGWDNIVYEHPEGERTVFISRAKENYRLRKVQLYEWTYLHNETYKSGETMWAFKVEKKEVG